jgi:hypothetical protein
LCATRTAIIFTSSDFLFLHTTRLADYIHM